MILNRGLFEVIVEEGDMDVLRSWCSFDGSGKVLLQPREVVHIMKKFHFQSDRVRYAREIHRKMTVSIRSRKLFRHLQS